MTTNNKMINCELLKSKNACKDQLDLFNKLFPDGIIPTRELCIECALTFDWDWAARKLLSKNGCDIYQESTALALKIYNESAAPALKIYQESIEPAWKIFHESVAPARKIYDESIAPAWKIYNETRAIVWFDCWKMENG